jgi:hypothetical protein
MVMRDGARASHDLIERPEAVAARPGHQLIDAAGEELGERERSAIAIVPDQAWWLRASPLLDR